MLTAWYLLYVLGVSWHIDMLGPFPSEAMCRAAQQGARDFGAPADCVPDYGIDDYLVRQGEIEEMMNGQGDPT